MASDEVKKGTCTKGDQWKVLSLIASGYAATPIQSNEIDNVHETL